MRSIVFTVTNDLTYDQRMDRICRTLVDAGYLVTLVGFSKSSSTTLTPKPYHQVRLHLVFSKGKMFYLEYNFRLLWWLLSNQFDIYGAVDLDTLLPQYWVSRWRKKPCIHDAHEYFTELPEIANRPQIKKIWQRLARWLLPKIKYNYTVCQSIATELSQTYGQPYAVIRNVPWLQDEQTEKSKFSAQTPVFIYQGALNKGRGIEQMMEAMGSVDAELWLVGEGDLSEQLRQMANKLSWSDRITFLGYTEPARLKQITAAAYAGLNLVSNEGKSYYYSLSNKFFDYIKAGIPQITMSYPEYKTLNDQYQIAITIPELKTEFLVNAMQQMLTDVQLYQQLKANTSSAIQDLNWEKERIKLIEFYAGVS